MEVSEIIINGKNHFTLQKKHKHTILSRLFRSKSYSLEEKNETLNRILGDDKSDLALNARARCEAGLPNAETKAKIWAEITDTNSKDSVNLRYAKIGGFYCWDQIDIVSPYFDKFFDEIERIHKFTNHMYFENFFHSLLPTMNIKESHIVKLVSLRANTPDLE